MKFSCQSLALCVLAFAGAALSTSGLAETRALIMGISDYPQQPLAGVVKDIDSASQIAKAFGVRPENLVIKRDKELSAAGMQKALDDFAQQIKPGDRAFVYYSGHGTSETGAGGKCEQSLVGYDMNLVSKRDFQAKVDAIGRVASNTVVVLDSCFSGGLISGAKSGSRSMDGDDVATPKFINPKMSNGVDACSEASNFNSGSRGDSASPAAPGFYLLGAAGDKEYAIDGGRRVGGFATSSLLACLEPEAKADADADGVLTFAEVKRCAQSKVSAMVKPPFTKQTLTDAGNLARAVTPFLGGGSPQPTSRPPANASQGIDSRKLLDTLAKSADPGHQVRLTSAQPAYKIKQDYLDLQVVSSKSGYVSLLSVGSSGRIFQLFPNGADSDNKIAANVPLSLPREHWRVPSNGPAGPNRFLAVVTTRPFVFSDMGVPVAGRYQAFAPTADNAQRIVRVLNTPAANCAKSPQRDFDSVEVNACNTSYGAGVVDVQEVN